MNTTLYTAKPSGQESRQAAKRKRLLCVDDDEDTGYMMLHLLGGYGYEVVIADSVADALELAKRGGFNLYILDNWLLQGTGVELCERIRVFDQSTPILFYSAAGYEADIHKGMECGAQAYLVKPDIEGLKETIARLVNNAAINACL